MRPIDETGHPQDDDAALPRYSQRLSDQLTGSFYEACRIGSLDTAKHLLLALECEVVRAAGTVAGADLREDGDDISAVRARLALELKRRQLIRRV